MSREEHGLSALLKAVD